jgi:hypothetical protein
MLRNLTNGEPVCLTVTHFDSLVLARSGFNHTADYRSVMVFGRARIVTESDYKKRAMRMMVDRLFPDRTAQLRATLPQELNATTLIAMDIERASAKIRASGLQDNDDEADYILPVYAERIPLQLICGVPEACSRLLPGVVRPRNLDGYRAGRPLEAALAEARLLAYGSASRAHE